MRRTSVIVASFSSFLAPSFQKLLFSNKYFPLRDVAIAFILQHHFPFWVIEVSWRVSETRRTGFSATKVAWLHHRRPHASRRIYCHFILGLSSPAHFQKKWCKCWEISKTNNFPYFFSFPPPLPPFFFSFTPTSFLPTSIYFKVWSNSHIVCFVKWKFFMFLTRKLKIFIGFCSQVSHNWSPVDVSQGNTGNSTELFMNKRVQMKKNREIKKDFLSGTHECSDRLKNFLGAQNSGPRRRFHVGYLLNSIFSSYTSYFFLLSSERSCDEILDSCDSLFPFPASSCSCCFCCLLYFFFYSLLTFSFPKFSFPPL